MGEFEKQNNAVKADITKIKENAAPLLQTVDDRQFWTHVLTQVHTALPEKYIWITLLEPTSGGKPVTLGDPTKAAGRPTPPPVPPARPLPAGPPLPTRPRSSTGCTSGDSTSKTRRPTPWSPPSSTTCARPTLFNLDKTNDNKIVTARSPQNAQDWAFDYELELNLAQPLTIP